MRCYEKLFRAICILAMKIAGSQDIVNKTAYWDQQKIYLCTQAETWLPTVGMPRNALVQLWSECRPAAIVDKSCVLIMDSPKLVCALCLLQGCAKQSLQDASRGVSARQYAVLGKVVDLDQHLKDTTASSFCESYGLQLVGAYSTSKPETFR